MRNGNGPDHSSGIHHSQHLPGTTIPLGKPVSDHPQHCPYQQEVSYIPPSLLSLTTPRWSSPRLPLVPETPVTQGPGPPGRITNQLQPQSLLVRREPVGRHNRARFPSEFPRPDPIAVRRFPDLARPSTLRVMVNLQRLSPTIPALPSRLPQYLRGVSLLGRRSM